MFLVLAIRLSSATLDQASVMFSTTLVVLFVGSAAVTLNAVLLGAKVNIFQTVCVLGYCVFPLLCASFVGLVVPFFLRVVAVTVAYAWTLVASTTFLGELNLARKRPLALYPIALFYLLVAWLVLVTP